MSFEFPVPMNDTNHLSLEYPSTQQSKRTKSELNLKYDWNNKFLKSRKIELKPQGPIT